MNLEFGFSFFALTTDYFSNRLSNLLLLQITDQPLQTVSIFAINNIVLYPLVFLFLFYQLSLNLVYKVNCLLRVELLKLLKTIYLVINVSSLYLQIVLRFAFQSRYQLIQLLLTHFQLFSSLSLAFPSPPSPHSL